jgi:phosphoribosylamine--glycine ligase
LLKGDLLEIMMACTNGTLSEIKVEFSQKSACCVVMASNGYPAKYSSGYEITRDAEIDGEVYVAGAKLDNGKLLSAGGRVLGVTSVGDSLEGAIKESYKNVEKVHFGNAFWRKEIGQRALKAYQEK